MWSIPPPTISAARETHDVTDVLHTTSFASSFASALTAAPTALVHALPQTPQFPALPPLSAGAVSPSEAYLLPALHRARLTKSDAEIQRIRRANEISSRAHEVVMRVLGVGVRGALTSLEAEAARHHPPLPGEWLIEREAEAEAIFVASCRREGCAMTPFFRLMCHVDDLRSQCCASGVLADRSGVDPCGDTALLLQRPRVCMGPSCDARSCQSRSVYA